jgi:hypothetical protein
VRYAPLPPLRFRPASLPGHHLPGGPISPLAGGKLAAEQKLSNCFFRGRTRQKASGGAGHYGPGDTCQIGQDRHNFKPVARKKFPQGGLLPRADLEDYAPGGFQC